MKRRCGSSSRTCPSRPELSITRAFPPSKLDCGVSMGLLVKRPGLRFVISTGRNAHQYGFADTFPIPPREAVSARRRDRRAGPSRGFLVTLHGSRERGAVVLLDPQQPQRPLAEFRVPRPQRRARERDHRAAEPQSRLEATTGSHAPQRLELRFIGGAAGVAWRMMVFHAR